MANDNNKSDKHDDPQRMPSRPEDNPFIAFRRYADSQVSSLLNTVFTLPAQIANYNNAHKAREQCLFGKADPQICEKLQALDAHAEKLRHEGAESYHAGDVQAVLSKSEELMVAESQASELRKSILIEAGDLRQNAKEHKQLVEEVGNRKGRQWSNSWDWPEPNRDDDTNDNDFGKWIENRARRAGGDIERLLAVLEEEASKVFGEEIEELRRQWAAQYNDPSQREDAPPQVWSLSRSWQWPPAADAQKQLESKRTDDSYSPSVLEADERTKHMGSLWRNAFEDLMRTTQEHPLLSDVQNKHFDQLGLYALRDYHKELSQVQKENKGRLPEPRQKQAQEYVFSAEVTRDTGDEPSYEYAHDHEDQHDDPPTPKPSQSEFPRRQTSGPNEQQRTETELDAYERLLAPLSTTSATEAGAKLSILSTLTTTERTTAPDGTTTTKVVLKKRFADGSEQSSETVHTQRSQDIHHTGDARKIPQDVLSSDNQNQKGANKRGWFWSN